MFHPSNIHFFSDAREAIIRAGCLEIIFADDLNAFQVFDSSVSNDMLYNHVRGCQTELHQWGRANGVQFDPEKEYFRILSRSSPDGDIFKHLGVPFDCKLLMHEAIDHCARESGWRTRGILHCRRFYTLRELFLLYKSHVLSFIEYRAPAISHAASSALSLLDCVQERFTRALGVSEEDALLQFCLAPLAARRDMAILGLIHRTALGLGPSMFEEFFVLDRSSAPSRALRSSSRRHSRQLRDPCHARAPDYLLQSLLGAVRLYNILPESIVSQSNVKDFQRGLQALLCHSASARTQDWQRLFCWRGPLAFHPLRAFSYWRP